MGDSPIQMAIEIGRMSFESAFGATFDTRTKQKGVASRRSAAETLTDCGPIVVSLWMVKRNAVQK